MARILVFNNDTNQMETYFRGDNERMPYNAGGTLTVREFRARSGSRTLWTEKRAMQAWNSFRYIYGKPIILDSVFRKHYREGYSRAKSTLCRSCF